MFEQMVWRKHWLNTLLVEESWYLSAVYLLSAMSIMTCWLIKKGVDKTASWQKGIAPFVAIAATFGLILFYNSRKKLTSLKSFRTIEPLRKLQRSARWRDNQSQSHSRPQISKLSSKWRKGRQLAVIFSVRTQTVNSRVCRMHAIRYSGGVLMEP